MSRDYLLSKCVPHLLDNVRVGAGDVFVVANIALCLFETGLFATKHRVPHDFNRIHTDFSGKHFVQTHASLRVFNWAVVNRLLNLFINELKDKVTKFTLEAFTLEHFKQTRIESAYAVVASQTEVSKVFAQVVHHDYFVGDEGLDLSMHHLEGFAFYTRVVSDPFITFGLVSLNFLVRLISEAL